MLGAMVVAAWLTAVPRAMADARTVRKAADAGAWDFLDRRADRVEARRRRRADAYRALLARRGRPDADAQPGLAAYAADHYRAFWARRMEVAQAKRAARPTYVYDPDRSVKARASRAKAATTRWMDRADAAIVDRAKKVAGSRPVRAVVEPVGGFPERNGPDHVEAAPVDPWDHSEPIRDPEQTVRLHRQAPEQPGPAERGVGVPAEQEPAESPKSGRPSPLDMKFDGNPTLNSRDPDAYAKYAADLDRDRPGWWECADEEMDGELADEARRRRGGDPPDSDSGDAPTGGPDDETNDDNDNNGGTDMTAPTGEAVNYETAIAELDAQEQQWRDLLDQAEQVRAAAAQLKAAADGMQTLGRNAAGAAQATHDNLAARNLDGQTLAATGDAATAMDPNELDALYEQVEAMEAQADQKTQEAEAGLASVASARSTLEEKYGDAHATVAGELGGDASFLDSSGATAAQAA